MAEWRAYAKTVEKKNKALEKAQQKSSAARSRLNEGAQQPASLENHVPVIQALMSDVLQDKDLDIVNVSDKVCDFSQTKAVKYKLEEVSYLKSAGNYQTQIKWTKATMSKDGLDSMVTEVSNKKLHDTVKQVFKDMDSRIQPVANFFITFPPDLDGLKKAVVDYQICVYDAGFSSVNVSSFCLPEVVCCVSGKLHVVGAKLEAVDGENVAKKLETFHNYDKDTIMKIAAAQGFAFTLEEGACAAIPSGSLVSSFVSEDASACEVVRYSFMRRADYEASHAALTGMLQSFEYLASTDYKKIKDLMEASFASSKD